MSKPELNFPARFLKNAANLMHNGATVNGESTQANPRFAKSPAVPDVYARACGMMPEFT